MPVITISRQLGSLGDEVAQLLGKQFDCNYLDKESLENLFGQFGMPKESLERFDERKPGFWDLFKTDKARYLHFLKEAVFEYARKGNGIILGRGGQVLLHELPGVLHVRIVSPMEIRIKRVMEQYECDERHAEKIVLHSDSERSGFHRFFFGENWEDVNLYDMVINTGSFSVETAVGLIKSIISTKEFKAQQKNTAQKLEDLCLEHEIKTAVIYKGKVVVQFLEVASENGNVTLRGIVEHNEDVERIGNIVSDIEGINDVNNEVYYSPITTAYGIHY
jgi:cytidylate kinase